MTRKEAGINKYSPLQGLMLCAIGVLGIFSFGIWLSYLNIADFDLWARLVQGASIWNTGHLIHNDMFAFTPVLSEYVDHEWGSGLIFFSLLKIFGPASLLILKVILGIGAVFFTLFAGRASGTKWTTLFIIAIPAVMAVYPGYDPVIRSHAFTYVLFSITLLCLEEIRLGRRWPAFLVVVIMALWANLHGGFVAGLGIIMLYALEGYFLRRRERIMFLVFGFSLLVTFINPYGVKLWKYLIPALLMPRSSIIEWRPMPLWGPDIFFGFRIIFVIAAISVVMGWKKVNERPLSALMLIITAYLSFKHMRHAPFFGLATIVFLGPYLETGYERLKTYLPAFFKRINSIAAILAIYFLITVSVVLTVLPMVRLNVITPSVFFPVKPVDILIHSKITGNLVVSFGWGNYAMWRLYPNIKISICGRYEAMYPESTFLMNEDFFLRKGKDWDRIFRQCKVDFIIFNFSKTRPHSSDIDNLGFEMVWHDDFSALFARKEIAPALRNIAANLPAGTQEALDAHIPDNWWR